MDEHIQQPPVTVDIIMLSYAKDAALRALTDQALKTLFQSEDPAEIAFNVVIVESRGDMAPYQYPGTTTIYPEGVFGFHKFLNIGVRMTANPYFVLCNNDLIFHKGWAGAILNEMRKDPELQVACPYDPLSHPLNGIADTGENYYDPRPGLLIGWCIFFRRGVIDIIGELDEKIEFWYSDNDVGKNLVKHNLKYALVTTSKVDHLGSQSINTFTPEVFFNITYGSFLYFDYKWNHKNRLIYNAKNLFLPVFRKAMINKHKGGIYPLSARVLAKIYGGYKTTNGAF